ncbi:MAG TPA: LysR family transcriptional regulator [Stackebrandtia sp.]|nr:LysR family transcriptional regulator [Stackebrandtia sp.]HZE40886.1 LysR family transcriptional regulator [Stackebrandtia sp.]
MDIMRHLECFLAVGEERHFGRAARRLGMEQPPLSQRIRRMEKELGAELFDRGGGQVTLTAAGHVLMNEAPELLRRYRRMRTLVRRAAIPETAETPRPWSEIY